MEARLTPLSREPKMRPALIPHSTTFLLLILPTFVLATLNAGTGVGFRPLLVQGSGFKNDTVARALDWQLALRQSSCDGIPCVNGPTGICCAGTLFVSTPNIVKHLNRWIVLS
jgi:hypothetical protein